MQTKRPLEGTQSFRDMANLMTGLKIDRNLSAERLIQMDITGEKDDIYARLSKAEETRRLELRFALMVACRTSIQVADDIGDIVQQDCNEGEYTRLCPGCVSFRVRKVEFANVSLSLF